MVAVSILFLKPIPLQNSCLLCCLTFSVRPGFKKKTLGTLVVSKILTIMFSSADLASQQLRNTGTKMFLHGGQKICKQPGNVYISTV